jgi:flagellar basal body-associated protein FliL
LKTGQSCFYDNEAEDNLDKPDDSKTPTKVESKSASFEVEPGLMSLEDLDKIIEENDPDALKNIEVMKESAELNSQTIELLQIDDIMGDPKRKKIDHFAKIQFKIKLFFRWLKSAAQELAVKFWIQTKTQSKVLNDKRQALQKNVGAWNKKQKALFAIFLLLSASTLTFAYFAFVKKTIHYEGELFVGSLLPLASEVIQLKSDEPMEDFYNTIRVPKNIFSLRRMVINIQPSESSGPNPMVAYELSLETNSKEALVELKDREGEIIDQIQRSIEQLTFDELSAPEGRDLVEDKVRARVNQILTLGQVRHVYIVAVIFKR